MAFFIKKGYALDQASIFW